VKPKDFKTGRRASSRLKRALDRLGAHPEDIRRVAISAYEAEMNLVIHADEGGELIVEIEPEMIHLSVIDQGPGIPDIEKAMSPGFSTAPNWIRELGFGAGMGLGNIKKCSDSVSLESEVGGGTKLDIVIYLRQELSEESNQTRKKKWDAPIRPLWISDCGFRIERSEIANLRSNQGYLKFPEL
jgi:anti-sigma regulatory factor (Ser/Thr protein kinase)